MKKVGQFALLGILLLIGGCKKDSQTQQVTTSSTPTVVQAAAPASTFDGSDAGCARLGQQILENEKDGWHRKNKTLVGVYHNSARSACYISLIRHLSDSSLGTVLDLLYVAAIGEEPHVTASAGIFAGSPSGKIGKTGGESTKDGFYRASVYIDAMMENPQGTTANTIVGYYQHPQQAEENAPAQPKQEANTVPDRQAAIASAVRRGNVVEGMTKQQVLGAWGSPHTVDTMTSSDGVIEQWNYEQRYPRAHIFFNPDGKVKSIYTFQ